MIDRGDVFAADIEMQVNVEFQLKYLVKPGNALGGLKILRIIYSNISVHCFHRCIFSQFFSKNSDASRNSKEHSRTSGTLATPLVMFTLVKKFISFWFEYDNQANFQTLVRL